MTTTTMTMEPAAKVRKARVAKAPGASTQGRLASPADYHSPLGRSYWPAAVSGETVEAIRALTKTLHAELASDWFTLEILTMIGDRDHLFERLAAFSEMVRLSLVERQGDDDFRLSGRLIRLAMPKPATAAEKLCLRNFLAPNPVSVRLYALCRSGIRRNCQIIEGQLWGGTSETGQGLPVTKSHPIVVEWTRGASEDAKSVAIDIRRAGYEDVRVVGGEGTRGSSGGRKKG